VIRIKTEVAGPIGSDLRLLKDIFASLSYLDSSVLAVKQYPRRLIELGMVYNDAVDCRRTREEELSDRGWPATGSRASGRGSAAVAGRGSEAVTGRERVTAAGSGAAGRGSVADRVNAGVAGRERATTTCRGCYRQRKSRRSKQRRKCGSCERGPLLDIRYCTSGVSAAMIPFVGVCGQVRVAVSMIGVEVARTYVHMGAAIYCEM
jgi:hypothetical protein